MSIERKDIGLDNAARSSKLFTLSLRENDHIKVITDNIKTAKERIIEYAQDLAQRIDLKDESLEITEYYQIGSYIKRKLRLAETDEHKINYVNDCLEEYPEYKDHRYDKLTKGSANRSLENLVLEPDFTNLYPQEFLNEMGEKNPNYLKILNKSTKVLIRNINESARNSGVKLVEDDNKDKESTPEPEPGESRMHFSGVQLNDSLFSFAEHYSVLVEKINQYPPPKNDEFDRHVTVRFERVKKMVDNLDRYIQVLVDERYLFSPAQWAVIDFGKETVGIPKHPDSLGSKITTLDDKSREMTDKNIRKRKQKMDKLLDEFNDSVKDIERMIREMVYELSQWNDTKSDYAKAKATRQDNVHDKLSEAAFGHDDGRDYQD